MSILISFLTIVMVVVCLLIVLLVLMQRPKQEGLGSAFGGGMTDQMFGAQTSNVLQRGTVWLAIAFFAISMLLSILISKRNKKDESLGSSLGEGQVAEAPVEVPPAGEDTLPTAPGEVDAAAAAAVGVELPTAEEAAAPEAVSESAPPVSAPEATPVEPAPAPAPAS